MITKKLVTPVLVFILYLAFLPSSFAVWDDFIDLFKEKSDVVLDQKSLSNDEVIRGLKQALEKGSNLAVTSLGKEDGFFSHPQFKIPMPEKLQSVESALRKLRQDKIADEFILSMNRAAEKAVPEAAAIFTNAIKAMSIEDAYGILKGPDSAATDFLRKSSGKEIYQAFLPIVKQTTNKVGVTENYKQLIDNLGVMSNFIDIESLDLDNYVTNRAVDSLFTLVAKEEKLIRSNPAARTTEILKKVFSE